MNKKRHGTFFVLDRELFSLKKIQKKFKKITERHGTCRTVSLSPSHNIFPLSSNDLLNIENKSKLKEENKYKGHKSRNIQAEQRVSRTKSVNIFNPKVCEQYVRVVGFCALGHFELNKCPGLCLVGLCLVKGILGMRQRVCKNLQLHFPHCHRRVRRRLRRWNHFLSISNFSTISGHLVVFVSVGGATFLEFLGRILLLQMQRQLLKLLLRLSIPKPRVD